LGRLYFADGRPVLPEMTAQIKAECDNDYVMSMPRSRPHRNAIDAAITKRALRAAGFTAMIMDYNEDIAIGDLVATVLDGANEQQWRVRSRFAYNDFSRPQTDCIGGKAESGTVNFPTTHDPPRSRCLLEREHADSLVLRYDIADWQGMQGVAAR
jgi:hypothetical protein